MAGVSFTPRAARKLVDHVRHHSRVPDFAAHPKGAGESVYRGSGQHVILQENLLPVDPVDSQVFSAEATIVERVAIDATRFRFDAKPNSRLQVWNLSSRIYAAGSAVFVVQNSWGDYMVVDAPLTSYLAKATSILPARATMDQPGVGQVRLQYLNPATGFINDLIDDDSDVFTWTSSPSANPDDDPKGFIYVWVTMDAGGWLWWTGEDCPAVDPGEPIAGQPGGQIPGGSNTVIITEP